LAEGSQAGQSASDFIETFWGAFMGFNATIRGYPWIFSTFQTHFNKTIFCQTYW